MANVIQIVIKQSGEGSAIVDANKALGGMKGVGDTAISTLLGVGKALTGVGAIAATALIGFGVSGVKAAMDVDHQLAQIAATLGTTKDAAMPLKDLMTELALDPKLTVNVTQAGEAIEVLAANGLELEEILAGGAKGAVQLANATGSDFATAATIATDAMQQFGFKASELEKVADGIAGVLIKSKFDADDYALALSNAGGIAGNLGVDLTDFNTVLAATSSFFSSGSDAGTSFKTLLTRLSKPTDDVKAAMEEFGLSIFDSSGQMKPFAEIAGDLQSVFKGLNEEEKAELATRLGGADAMRTVLGLAGMTEEQFKTLSAEVNKSGLASQAAATRVDSLTGAWEIFKGIIEAVQIQVGDKFLPIIRRVTEAVSVWASENSGGIVALFGTISTGIDSLISKGTELAGAFQTGGTGGLLSALGIGPEGIELFDKVMASITSISDTIANVFTPALEGITSSGAMDAINTGLAFLNEHFEEIQGAIVGVGVVLAGGILASIGVAIAGLVGPVTLLVAGAALLGAAWAGNWGGIRDKTMEVWAAIQPALSTMVTWLQTNIPVAVQAASDIWANTLLPALTNAGVWIDTTLIPALTTMVTWLQTNIPVAIQVASDIWNTNFLPGLTAAGEFITGTLVPAFTEMQTWLQTNIPPAIETLAGIWNDTLLPALETGYENFSLMVDLLTSLGELINAVLTKALEALAGLWQNVLWPALQKVGKILSDTLMPAFTSIGQTVKKDVSPVLKDLGETVMPLLQEGLDFVTKSIKEVIGYFDSLKATVNSFTLPDILTPGSPPPMANALTDIATSAGAASTALAGMGRSLLTSSSSALSFIDDLDMGGLARGFGTGGGQWKNFRNILKNEIMGGMSALADGTADVMDSVYKVAARFNFPPGMAAEFAKANGLVEHLTGNFEKFRQQMNIQNLGNMTQMAASFSGLGSTFADMLGPKLSETSKEIIYLQKFLATTDELSSDGLWNRVMGQEELVKLLEKQARQEELITQQKEAQQKLDFLKSQLDLLKLGQSLGGDIFQGITFGLNASVEDMLAAVNAVTMAMVDQIDHDLGIASPSKLLFDKFKNQIGGAMVGGLLAVRPMMEGAIQPILNPIMQGANAAGRVVNNYFNQTVNTRADSSSVIGDFRTMQLMAG